MCGSSKDLYHVIHTQCYNFAHTILFDAGLSTLDITRGYNFFNVSHIYASTMHYESIMK